jgi:hypothetical protein
MLVWFVQALQNWDHTTNHVDKYITLRYFPDDVLLGEDNTASVLMPFHYRPASEFVLISKLDSEAWKATQAKERDTTEDLPAEASTASIDQPSYEIMELGKVMVAETVTLQAAALRRDLVKMKEVLARMSLHVRGARALIGALDDALACAE